MLVGIPVTAVTFFVLGGKTAQQRDIEVIEITSTPTLNEELVYDKELPYQEESQVFVPEWQSYTVAKGDNFSVISARELGLNPADVVEITELSKDVVKLSQLKLGQEIHFLLGKEGRLQKLRLSVKVDLDYLVERQGKAFKGQEIKKAITKTHQIYRGTVSHSLGGAMQDQGVPYALAVNAGNLLGKRNDLRRDLRAGDQFEVMVVSDEVDGELFSPKIEALRVHGSRINTSLFLHSDGQFYDAEGKGLEPGFNRFPLEKTYRVSSPFDFRRKHPVTGLVRPHYGTDFATPVGTNIIAPADGTVKRAGFHQYAGNYLVIEHYNGYITRYFHLSKILVKKGQDITSGDSIALTGNTGRTTGAHLHYELHKKGKPVDPMRTNLPASRDLQGKELAAFQERVSRQIAALENNDSQLVISDNSEIKESTPNPNIS